MTPQATVTAVANRIPEQRWATQFGGRQVAVCVGAPAVIHIPKDRVEEARQALLSLPQPIADRMGYTGDWRSKPLNEMLRNWGWGADVRPDGSVICAGTWGDVVFPECFAALSAVAPFVEGRGGEMVFAPGADGDEHSRGLFAVRTRNGELEIAAAQATVELDIDW